MKISYSWLKDYIKLDQSPEEICEILTQTGLEVGSLEEVETVKGGMKGLVTGKVLSCAPHPNSDHLSKTTVDIGTGEELRIVCGAPNVAAGQKVVVAPVGTTLYMGDQELTLKKMKIRGEVSQGMICAEDEIGIGTNHEGIIVLDENTEVGQPAKEIFNVKSDWVIEIDLTPNRIDGASHIGVARDLAAFLNQQIPTKYTRPSVANFKTDNHNLEIPVEVKTPDACPRYAGVTISNLEIKESPDWLKNRLKAIGHTPINNVVDITNYVLFETGQPLHAFDADEITGNKVVVSTLNEGTKFTTLDEVERKLHADDLMICNTEAPMCIGGVFGGIQSGVKETTKSIFLESAWFNPVYIRKTARRHGLNTDASFRFERGTDPNGVIYALKRAALLMKELAGGTITSEIVDVYPEKAEHFPVHLSWFNLTRLIGKELEKEQVKTILASLEIDIEGENEKGLDLKVPPYRVDVKREADVIEEILRIYGYNNVETPSQIRASLQYAQKPDPDQLRNLAAEMLTAQGFNEIWSNSLTKEMYYEGLENYKRENTVNLLNPLSADLNGMRQTLLFGGLECISYNANRQNKDLKLYEFGNCYFFKGTEKKNNPVSNYHEEEHLGLFITGAQSAESWEEEQKQSSFFQLKSIAENLLKRFGFNLEQLQISGTENELFAEGLNYQNNNKTVLEMGIVSKKFQTKFEIDNPVYYADFWFETLLDHQKKHAVTFSELPKFPSVRRDLALLIDKNVTFQQIKDAAFKTERKILKDVGLFDVYEGKGIPEDKKSYAVKFTLRDENRTLKDKQIDKTMKKLLAAFERDLGAQLRG
ncbi:phenylalanyl-tRNA synthetase beta subunit [Tangfeifania diversioriginum]|uniref:Phenylalanine--tRNA ligase beta subunit n=1 Tax=Tangfeifania diversioriginum TaxID=1168035 RepID=A0A1M6CVX2_9BACT|nr:phenylalanine--tRNA ligase subunit beta [Tangfeifania diversioriginum]SHI65110.1 phenylalanyl-tRNA synthetase beta subunit [Tangfeifania diversioriginum]